MTVCGWFQSEVVKVSEVGETEASSVFSLVRSTTTMPLAGAAARATVKVASAPSFASVAAPLSALTTRPSSRMVIVMSARVKPSSVGVMRMVSPSSSTGGSSSTGVMAKVTLAEAAFAGMAMPVGSVRVS